MSNGQPENKPETIGSKRKRQITNYVVKKQGLVGEAARAIVKKDKTMRDLLKEMDK